ncbi:unnamed protein product [Effrenium voratum]|nr:unnamed protein product [Effrenium voratum]
MQLVDGEPCPLLWAKQLLAAPASPLLLLGEPGGTEGYSLSPRLLHELRSCDNQVQPSAQQMIAQLCSLAKAIHPGPVACAGLLTHRPSARPAPPLPRPLLRSKRIHDGIKVVVITLAHRADRRVEPLVGSPASLAALRHAGLEVEVLRASCYCERDALEQYGRLPSFFGDLWAEFRRYEGADKPLDSEEEEELLDYVNENYNHGAERLVDPDDGDLAGYLRDTNWPGATSCAMSHLRALVKSALDGHQFTLICEDDAVIPTEVAKKRGWCEGCEGKLCFCPTAWVCCVQEAVELMRRAPHLDLLYLGVGEAFEPHGEEILAADSDSEDDLGGITELGYTWCAEAILYARSALEDVLALSLHERLWAQDETIPHLYSRKPSGIPASWHRCNVLASSAVGWRELPRKTWRRAGSSSWSSLKRSWMAASRWPGDLPTPRSCSQASLERPERLEPTVASAASTRCGETGQRALLGKASEAHSSLLPLDASGSEERRPAKAAKPCRPEAKPDMRPSVVLRLKQLHQACRVCDVGAVQRSLEEGAPANGRDESGWAALHYSAFAGSAEATLLLLESSGDCNAVLPDLSTPLMLAVDEGHLAVAKLLLQYGALTKCKDEDGFTALARCEPSVKEEFRIMVSGEEARQAR